MNAIIFGTFWVFFGELLFSFLLTFLPVTYNFLNVIFPSFIGYIILILGINHIDTDNIFSRARKDIKIAVFFDFAFWIISLCSPTILQSIFEDEDTILVIMFWGFSGLVYILKFIYYISVFYLIAKGLEELQSKINIQLFGHIASLACGGIIFFTIAASLGDNIAPIIGSVLSIISLIFQIIYFVALIASRTNWYKKSV